MKGRSIARAALKAEGFGIITEIDVQKTLHEKIGVAFRKLILCACNPTLTKGPPERQPVAVAPPTADSRWRSLV